MILNNECVGLVVHQIIDHYLKGCSDALYSYPYQVIRAFHSLSFLPTHVNSSHVPTSPYSIRSQVNRTQHFPSVHVLQQNVSNKKDLRASRMGF